MIDLIIGFLLLVIASLIVWLGIPFLMIAIPLTGALLAIVVILIGLAGTAVERIKAVR